ncbi:MAG TPA: RNA pyrophosphohydrolase [Steroidobacteraceae bacterium]|jgi:putative (di)nucleoside polyphosphate hydrolase|nr:RNA pyrophosphohydrolase [Steroidobacteraceae bacterium]
MQDVIDRDGFRINIGIVLSTDDGRLFLGRRARGRGWQFPQGGVGRGETLEESLFRELQEEIGLVAPDVRVLGRTRHWLRYRLPARFLRHDVRPLCVGQKQHWFLLRLREPTAAFRFDATPEPEFDQWRWVDYWQPIREVVYFKRAVYTRVLHEFGPRVFPRGLPPRPSWGRTGRAQPLPAATAEPGKPGA